MKRKSHPLITKGILILLSLILLIFISSYAWFTDTSKPITASGISAKSSASSDFEVAVGFSTHKGTDDTYLVSEFTKNEFNFNNLKVGTKIYSLFDDWTPLDLTGDGYTIVRPGLTGNNTEVDDKNPSFSTPTPNREYLAFDFIFRAPSPTSVSLAADSLVITPCEESGGASIPDSNKLVDKAISDFNASTYGKGSFSKDAIVGALRLSSIPYKFTESADLALDVLGNSTTYYADKENFVWLPRPDMKLIPGQSTENYTLQTAGDTTTREHVYWKYDASTTPIGCSQETYNGTLIVGSPTTEYLMCSVNYPHTETVNNTEVTTYYGKTRILVWIEGTDAESRRALAGGRFNIHFDLVG